MILYIIRKLWKSILKTDKRYDGYTVTELDGVLYITHKDDNTIPPVKISFDKSYTEVDVPYLSSHIPVKLKTKRLSKQLNPLLLPLLKFVKICHKEDTKAVLESDYIIKIMFVLSIILDDRDIVKLDAGFQNNDIEVIVNLVSNESSNVAYLRFIKLGEVEFVNVTIIDVNLEKEASSFLLELDSVIEDKYLLKSKILSYQLSEDISANLYNMGETDEKITFSIYLSSKYPKHKRNDMCYDILDKINKNLWKSDKFKSYIAMSDNTYEYVDEAPDGLVEYPIIFTKIDNLTVN